MILNVNLKFKLGLDLLKLGSWCFRKKIFGLYCFSQISMNPYVILKKYGKYFESKHNSPTKSKSSRHGRSA